MFKYVIEGGQELSGEIDIYGSKNTALTVLPVTLLTDEPVVFSNLPHTQDIVSMLALLGDIGADISMTHHPDNKLSNLSLRCSNILKTTAAYEFVSKMRASILLLGPMLARCKEAKISLPGGCAIGVRPVDLHIMAMETLGATIEIENGYITAKAPNGLHGARITFPKTTVGGTENAIMAAVLAKGNSIIDNAAIEPEIIHLCDILTKMGAKISGQGTHTIHITGVAKLNGAEYFVPSDRIQTFTYAIISAATGFGIKIRGASINDFLGTVETLHQMGIEIKEDAGKISLVKISEELKPISVTTAPIPGFPTDCQAQIMALLTTVDGVSVISEEIFENRMMHVPELSRMGANISISHKTATIRGVKHLFGAEVMATDLRASASLVIAGLMAKGQTTINRVYHIDRGYDFLPTKLESCGAKIRKIQS